METPKTKLILVVMIAILAIECVSAGDWVITTVPTSEERYTPTPGSDVTEGGNITAMNLDQEVQTGKWAAYYGNLTGNISLRNAAGAASVFNWAWTVSDGAEVCAISTASDFDWSSLANSTFSELDSIWGFTSGDTDSAASTYTSGGSLTEDFSIAGSGPLTTGSVETGPDVADTFETGVLEDGGDAAKNDYAFCVNTQASGTAYEGSTANYELIVPTNQTAGQTETFYFYVELN